MLSLQFLSQFVGCWYSPCSTSLQNYTSTLKVHPPPPSRAVGGPRAVPALRGWRGHEVGDAVPGRYQEPLLEAWSAPALSTHYQRWKSSHDRHCDCKAWRLSPWQIAPRLWPPFSAVAIGDLNWIRSKKPQEFHGVLERCPLPDSVASICGRRSCPFFVETGSVSFGTSAGVATLRRAEPRKRGGFRGGSRKTMENWFYDVAKKCNRCHSLNYIKFKDMFRPRMIFRPWFRWFVAWVLRCSMWSLSHWMEWRPAFQWRRRWVHMVMFFWPMKWTVSLWTWSMGLLFESSPGPQRSKAFDLSFWNQFAIECKGMQRNAKSIKGRCVFEMFWDVLRFQVWLALEMWNGLARSLLPATCLNTAVPCWAPQSIVALSENVSGEEAEGPWQRGIAYKGFSPMVKDSLDMFWLLSIGFRTVWRILTAVRIWKALT